MLFRSGSSSANVLSGTPVSPGVAEGIARVVMDPRGVLEEFGVKVKSGVEVRVHDSTAELRYLVLPRRPSGTSGWRENQLAALVTRDSMIGTAIPHAPVKSAAE